MGCLGDSNVSEENQTDIKGTIPDNVLLTSKSLIEIENENKIIPGFLFAIPKDIYGDLFFFMTLKENITNDMIEKKEAVKLYYDNRKKFITINLNSEERRIIKDLTDIGINLIVIEIFCDENKDNIEKEYFLSIMKQHDEFQDLKKEEIDLIHSDQGEIRYSKGKIEKIEKKEFTFSTKFKLSSPGSPIFFSNSKEVIGIQKSQNSAYF